MPMLRGIETTAIGRTKTVEVTYENRAYIDRNGKPVALIDMTCYACSNSYFVLDSDPIDFCPHCGRREGPPWASHDEGVAWARLHDFKWLRKLGLDVYGLRRGDGAWMLGFGRSSEALIGTGRYVEVRSLLPGGG